MKQSIKANKNVGENIKNIRKIKGMTQEVLAAQMQTYGCDISRGTLAKIEAGIRHISVEELNAIRNILNADYKDLLEK